MKAKELMFEFLEIIFLTILILFFFVYLFLGGHYAWAKKIFLISGFVSLSSIFFIRRLKSRKQEIEKLSSDGRDELIAYYLFPNDVFWDRVFMLALSCVIILIPAAFGKVVLNDYYLAGIAYVAIYVWRKFLFSKKDDLAEVINLTRVDCFRDEAVIFLLPLLLLIETVFKGGIEVLNIAQAMFVFFAYFFEHWRLFRRSA